MECMYTSRRTLVIQLLPTRNEKPGCPTSIRSHLCNWDLVRIIHVLLQILPPMTLLRDRVSVKGVSSISNSRDISILRTTASSRYVDLHLSLIASRNFNALTGRFQIIFRIQKEEINISYSTYLFYQTGHRSQNERRMKQGT